MSTEQRQAIRYSHECQVVVATRDKSCVAQLENLSESGCCIQKPEDWNFSSNDILNLYFVIDNEHIVDAEAMIVWEVSTHAGLQYLHAQAVPIQIIDHLS
jgi:hypothetical protein